MFVLHPPAFLKYSTMTAFLKFPPQKPKLSNVPFSIEKRMSGLVEKSTSGLMLLIILIVFVLIIFCVLLLKFVW
jgi:hypothetical protein